MVREKAMGVIFNYTAVPHVVSREGGTLLQAAANQVASGN